MAPFSRLRRRIDSEHRPAIGHAGSPIARIWSLVSSDFECVSTTWKHRTCSSFNVILSGPYHRRILRIPMISRYTIGTTPIASSTDAVSLHDCWDEPTDASDPTRLRATPSHPTVSDSSNMVSLSDDQRAPRVRLTISLNSLAYSASAPVCVTNLPIITGRIWPLRTKRPSICSPEAVLRLFAPWRVSQ